VIFWLTLQFVAWVPPSFFLLSQLRIAVSALLLRIWKGVQQSLLEWLALLQLSIGLLVLVQVQHRPELHADSAERTAEAMHGESGKISDEEWIALIALVGILATSAFATVYQEVQMKAHQTDSIFVQMLQLNLFQVIVSLGLLAHRMHNGDIKGALDGWDFSIVGFWMLCVGRGLLCSAVIKEFDSGGKGLSDIAAMIGVFILQIVVDGKTIDRPTAGLQLVLLMSVLCYFVGRHMAGELAVAKAGVAKRAAAGGRSPPAVASGSVGIPSAPQTQPRQRWNSNYSSPFHV